MACSKRIASASFSRPPNALNPFYTDFAAVYIHSKGKSFEEGFTEWAYDDLLDLVRDYDVTLDDWVAFMEELQSTAPLSLLCKSKYRHHHSTYSYTLPIIGYKIDFTTESRKNSDRLAVSLIGEWNQKFFYPRNIQISLLRGNITLTSAIRQKERCFPSTPGAQDRYTLVISPL